MFASKLTSHFYNSALPAYQAETNYNTYNNKQQYEFTQINVKGSGLFWISELDLSRESRLFRHLFSTKDHLPTDVVIKKFKRDLTIERGEVTSMYSVTKGIKMHTPTYFYYLIDNQKPFSPVLVSKSSKLVFDRHLRQYKSQEIVHRYHHVTNRTQILRPILLFHLPNSHIWPALVKWIHTRDDVALFKDLNTLKKIIPHNTTMNGRKFNRSNEIAFQLLELAKYLEMEHDIFTTLAKYLIQFTDGSITLSRRFHSTNIPPCFVSSFLSLCGWEEGDKLAILLWFCRLQEDDKKLRLKNGKMEYDDVMKIDRKFDVEEKELGAIANCYIDIANVDQIYATELRDLLPNTFEKLFKAIFKLD